MRQELAQLIERMTTRQNVSSSENSISWQAHREAEVLANTTLLSELDAYLDQKPTKEQRSAAYFIIGKIGENCCDEECASLLIKYASKETDKYVLASLLERISYIPKSRSVDVMPLLSFLKDEHWLVRHSAIQSLKRCQSAEAEDRLLDILATTLDSIDVVYCQATLNDIGTPKALPVLAQNLKSRKRDVKVSAQAAIEAIQSRGGQHVADGEGAALKRR